MHGFLVIQSLPVMIDAPEEIGRGTVKDIDPYGNYRVDILIRAQIFPHFNDIAGEQKTDIEAFG